MGKILNTYRAYTATDLKNRSNVPAAADIVTGTSSITCNNIDTTDVRNTLGASNNKVKELCTSANVNVWSNFAPVNRTITGSDITATLVNSVPTSEFRLGDFAGYNHTASAPGWVGNGENNAKDDIWIASGNYATFISDISIGEVDYTDLGGVGVMLVATEKVNGTIEAWGVESLSTLKEYANLTATTTNTVSIQRTYILRSYITNTTSIAASNNVYPAVVCRVPNVNDVEVTVKILSASFWYYDTTGTTTIPSPWIQNGSAGMNWSTGYMSIGSIYANTSYSQIKIYANLFNSNNQLVGSGTWLDGSYSAYQSVSGSVYMGMTNIPTNGYRVTVYFEESM